MRQDCRTESPCLIGTPVRDRVVEIDLSLHAPAISGDTALRRGPPRNAPNAQIATLMSGVGCDMGVEPAQWPIWAHGGGMLTGETAP